MGADERLEGAVEILGEGGGEAGVCVGGGEFDHHIRFYTLGPRFVAPGGNARSRGRGVGTRVPSALGTGEL